MALTDKQKKLMRINHHRKKEKILRATNNGQCWWLYQQLTNRTKYVDEKD